MASHRNTGRSCIAEKKISVSQISDEWKKKCDNEKRISARGYYGILQDLPSNFI
jgi:hypothetical protein